MLVIAVLLPVSGRAQEGARTDPLPQPAMSPGVRTASLRTEPSSVTANGATSRRLEELTARLLTLEARLRENPRIQGGAVAVAFGVAALGAMRGERSLTGVSTQALRLGLDRPLARIRQRSGFTVQPSIGYRTVGVMMTRTFP
jgi:hypothetical protein